MISGVFFFAGIKSANNYSTKLSCNRGWFRQLCLRVRGFKYPTACFKSSANYFKHSAIDTRPSVITLMEDILAGTKIKSRQNFFH